MYILPQEKKIDNFLSKGLRNEKIKGQGLLTRRNK